MHWSLNRRVQAQSPEVRRCLRYLRSSGGLQISLEMSCSLESPPLQAKLAQIECIGATALDTLAQVLSQVMQQGLTGKENVLPRHKFWTLIKVSKCLI